MRSQIENMKDAFLVICKYAGLFSICRYLTKNALRVLCCHGVSWVISIYL